MFLNQQEELSKAVNQIEQLTKEVQSGNDKLQRMMEQIILSNNARFGRSSEKMDNTDQISFMEVDGNIIFLMNLKQYAIYPPRSQKTWSLSHAERKRLAKRKLICQVFL